MRWEKLLEKYGNLDDAIHDYSAGRAIKSILIIGSRCCLHEDILKDAATWKQFEKALENRSKGWRLGSGIRLPSGSAYEIESSADWPDQLRKASKECDDPEAFWPEQSAIFRRLWRQNPACRQATMFFGYPFTSGKHPWPSHSTGEPYVPALQLNLNQLTESLILDDEDGPAPDGIGEGILQLWEPSVGTEYLLRHIPDEDLSDDVAQPLDSAAFEDPFRFEFTQEASVLFSPLEPRYLGVMFGSEHDFVSLRTVESFDESLQADPQMRAELAWAMIGEIYEREVSSGGTMLFGVPTMIQESYLKKWAKGGWRCLVQIDDDEAFNLGDGGTGQIMFRKRGGKFEYKFTWACF